MKKIKVTAGPNKLELPGNRVECSYCGRSDLPLRDSVIWRSCSPECELSFSYLLDGMSKQKIDGIRQEWKDDPDKLVKALRRCAGLWQGVRLTEQQYETLAAFAFSSENPGYKPSVVEAPNGDNVWDENKRYAHLAPKYFEETNVDHHEIKELYEIARQTAEWVCKMIEIPQEFFPGRDSTLRVLHYPPGATTAPHTDFDLFTICMYRDDNNAFKYLDGEEDALLTRARKFSPGIHFGELMTEINNAMATNHEVVGTERTQKSAVFFVVPEHSAVLPSGLTVGEWMAERKNRSRKVK